MNTQENHFTVKNLKKFYSCWTVKDSYRKQCTVRLLFFSKVICSLELVLKYSLRKTEHGVQPPGIF